MDGYEAMGFDVTQLTQDVEQSLFTIQTNMWVPMLVYGDAFQWAKCGHQILPSNLDFTSHNKACLHQTFRNPLIEFLHTDLDGNLLPSNLDWDAITKLVSIELFGSPLLCSFAQISLLSTFTQIQMEIYLSSWILLPLPSWIIYYQHCLRDYQKLQMKAKCLIKMCGMKKASIASSMR